MYQSRGVFSWYQAEANVESYRAVRTLPGQESVENLKPTLEEAAARRIHVRAVSVPRIRHVGTLPGLFLLHRRCIKIIRYAGSRKSKTSLLALATILTPTGPVDTANLHPLSDLDGDVLAAIFRPPSSLRNLLYHLQSYWKQVAAIFGLSSPPSLPQLLHDLPPELLSQILFYCQVEPQTPPNTLAICVGLADSYWKQVVSHDIARQRLIIGIQATQLLQKQSYHDIYTEKVVDLSREMTVTFVHLGSRVYLRMIKKRDESSKLFVNEFEIHFSLDLPIQLLALQADDLGIRNIAFTFRKNKMPKFLRGDNQLPNMFVDSPAGVVALRIISDVSTSCRA